LPKNIFEIKKGEAKVKILENRFQDKKFFIDAQTPTIFQLNTFNFIGWQAYLYPATVIPNLFRDPKYSRLLENKKELDFRYKDDTNIKRKKIQIDDKNDYKLITVFIPKGRHNLEFRFEDTWVRIIGNWLSIFSLLALLFFIKTKFYEKN